MMPPGASHVPMWVLAARNGPIPQAIAYYLCEDHGGPRLSWNGAAKCMGMTRDDIAALVNDARQRRGPVQGRLPP